jgi:hypothetical protein
VPSRGWPLHQAGDFLLVLLGWSAIVAGSALLPVDRLAVRPVALFVHLIFVPVGFGAVVMTSVYAVLGRTGRRSLPGVLALTSVAHQVMAAGLAGLTASGIALDPDLQSPLMRLKLVLLLVLMLSAVRAQQASRRIVGPIVVAQVAWWGAIGIGFLTTTSR